MKELKKLSLKEELDREAEKIEEEVGKRRDLDDLTVSEEAETALFNKIQDYEYDKRFKKTVHRSRKKRRILLAVAAVLVLICGSVITGTGSKSYLKVLMERIAGEDNLTNIDVGNMDAQTTDDLDEVYIFKEINKKTGISPVHLVYVPKKMQLKETGISPVHFGYIPEEMHLKRYEVNTELGSAELLYDYKGQTIQYSMYMNDADSSHGYTESDKLVNEYKITTEKQIDVVIQEYSVVNQDFHRFTAEFEYHNAQYQLVGLMEKEEFDQIIQKLRFYD